MLLVEQGVEQALALLPEADAPAGRADRVDDDRRRGLDDRQPALEQGEVQVAVLAPGGGEALVEAADGLQRVAAAEAVGRDELGRLQAGRVALVVGRRARAAGRRPGPRRPPTPVRRSAASPRPASAGRGRSRRR